MVQFKFGEFYKNPFLVLSEATIVGLLLIILVIIFYSIKKNKFILSISDNLDLFLIVGFSGALFHILCEYSGLNVWYSKNYCTYFCDINSDSIPK